MKQTLLFLMAISFMACQSPMKLYKKGNYTKAFDKAVLKIEKQPFALYKMEDALLLSFNALNQLDSALLGIKLDQRRPSFFKQKNIIYKIDNRQEKLLKIYQDMGKQLDISKLTFFDCTELLKDLESRALSYYHRNYNILMDSINLGYKYLAPLALSNLDSLHTYGSTSLNLNPYYINLFSNGISNYFIQYKNNTDETIFDNLIDEYDLQKANSLFTNFTYNYLHGFCDSITIEVIKATPGKDSYSESSSCYSKEIIDGYEEEIVEVKIPQPPIRKIEKIWCDSVWVEKVVWEEVPPKIEIEKRKKPIYKKVSATVTTTTLTKESKATTHLSLKKIAQPKVIHSKYCYSDDRTSVSGDDRALSLSVSSCWKTLSSPSDNQMLKYLKVQTNKDIINALKSISKGNKYVCL